MKVINSKHTANNQSSVYLQKTQDGFVVENGFYDLEERIICVSTQTGCKMGCIFCASNVANSSPARNLTKNEIVEQVKNILSNHFKDKDPKSFLFSLMGIGEPFLNYENVVKSIKLLAKDYPNSRATIATTGILPEKIRTIANESFPIILKIHLSLHAPNDTLRKKILPKAGKIKAALEALKYFSQTKDVTCKVNYLLIKGLNDSKKEATELAKLLKDCPFTVKLSELNPFNNLLPSEEAKFDLFEKILHSEGIETCRFSSSGTDIKAGCGQLRNKFDNSFLHHKKIRSINLLSREG